MVITPKLLTPGELMTLAQTIERDGIEITTVLSAQLSALQHLKAADADPSALDILIRVHHFITGLAYGYTAPTAPAVPTAATFDSAAFDPIIAPPTAALADSTLPPLKTLQSVPEGVPDLPPLAPVEVPATAD